jgi:hypothetical protein
VVGVLHTVADLHEQLEAFAGRQSVAVAVPGDGFTLDKLHREVGAAAFRLAGVEHPGDVRMAHHRQCLALGLESSDDLSGIHPGLDDLEGHSPTNGLFLLGLVHGTHSALADLLEDAVRADSPGGTGVGECGDGGLLFAVQRVGFELIPTTVFHGDAPPAGVAFKRRIS